MMFDASSARIKIIMYPWIVVCSEKFCVHSSTCEIGKGHFVFFLTIIYRFFSQVCMSNVYTWYFAVCCVFLQTSYHDEV